MKVSLIIPTIGGREQLLEQTTQSLAETCNGYETELIVVRNSPTVGEGWNQGVEASTGTHFWLGADDVTFSEGWLDAVVEAEARGWYPCPRILFANGEIEACGTIGQAGCILSEVEDGFLCGASSFPFMSRETWEEVGPSLPIGYFADDYLGYRARVAGLEVRLVRAYTLTHYVGTVGRAAQVAKHWQYREIFLKTIAEEHALSNQSSSPVDLASSVPT